MPSIDIDSIHGLSDGLRAAYAASREVRGTTSPNPPVGAALFAASGEVIASGGTQPAGGEHAEVQALNKAGQRARGAKMVVTLEPCNHTGSTGPCTEAIIAAGVAEVYFVHADPNPQAAGGAHRLAEAGIEVVQLPWEDLHAAASGDPVVPWLHSINHQRPHVTVKFAQTLDGFTAASDGTSQWITGKSAREHVHNDRAFRDAIVVGTGTALSDNPSLTARWPDGSPQPHQPRRVVVGARDVKVAAKNLVDLGFEQYESVGQALETLYETGARDILVEGGAGLISAFMQAGVVDAIQAYIAPVLLGDGRGVLAHPVAHTLGDAQRFRLVNHQVLGEDVLIEYSVVSVDSAR